jgi:hypothetical protein
MNYNPHTHLTIARARQEDMIRQAERDQLARSFKGERPGALSRLRTHLTRKHPVHPSPIGA